MLVHGTAVALGDQGLVIRGPSGAGKSDLALRLLATPLGGYPGLGIPPFVGIGLVSDDQVELAVRGGAVFMSAPEAIRSKLEVRGVGIVNVPSHDAVRLCLIVDLVERAAVERLPELRTVEILGVPIAAVSLTAFESITPLKVLLALRAM